MTEENKSITGEDENKEPDVENKEGDSTENKEPSKENIDYDAELKREQERRIAAEKATAEIAFKLREKKRKEEEEDGFQEEEDKPLTAKELEIILKQDREKTRKELQSEIISEKARKLAGSDSEAQLILEIHKNRSFPEGLSLDEQLEESYAITNRKTIMAQNAELKRALRSKETASDDVAGTQRESVPLNEPKISSHDMFAIKSAGFVWDGKANMWKKETHKRIILVSRDLKSQKVIEK